MKTLTKVLLIILAIIAIAVIGVGIYAGISLKKGLDLKKALEDVNVTRLEERAEEIRAGNCSMLAEFENDAGEIRTQVIEACKNAALRILVEEYKEGGCAMANDPNSDAQKELDELREVCGAV